MILSRLLSKFGLRPLYWWPAEAMNRLKLPDCLFRKYRRNEIAAVFRQARKDGYIDVARLLKLQVLGRAPKKNNKTI